MMADAEWFCIWTAIATVTIGYSLILLWLQMQIARLHSQLKGGKRMVHVEVYEDVDQQWRWRVVAANNKIIAESSEGYHNRVDCEAGALICRDALIDWSRR